MTMIKRKVKSFSKREQNRHQNQFLWLFLGAANWAMLWIAKSPRSHSYFKWVLGQGGITGTVITPQWYLFSKYWFWLYSWFSTFIFWTVCFHWQFEWYLWIYWKNDLISWINRWMWSNCTLPFSRGTDLWLGGTRGSKQYYFKRIIPECKKDLYDHFNLPTFLLGEEAQMMDLTNEIISYFSQES